MKVLVTGGAGYIGSMLVRNLLENGYDIIILDKLYFGKKSLSDIIDKVKLIEEDTRTFDGSILKGISIVIDLAAIGQPDPTSLLGKEIFYDINYKGSVRVAKLSKKYGVERYIFASTCSVYGFQDKIVSENSEPKPLEAYGESKLLAEREIMPLNDKDFCVTIFRFATAYGLSYKMRFDLVVNGMTLALYKYNYIKVMRPGTQRRPVVHVKDIIKAINIAMNSDKEIVGGGIFNVGSNDQNYEILQLAKLIGDAIGIRYELKWYGEPDTRSYVVDFSKIKRVLNYKTSYTPKEGAKEIYNALKNNIINDTPETYTITWFKYLIDSKQI